MSRRPRCGSPNHEMPMPTSGTSKTHSIVSHLPQRCRKIHGAVAPPARLLHLDHHHTPFISLAASYKYRTGVACIIPRLPPQHEPQRWDPSQTHTRRALWRSSHKLARGWVRSSLPCSQKGGAFPACPREVPDVPSALTSAWSAAPDPIHFSTYLPPYICVPSCLSLRSCC